MFWAIYLSSGEGTLVLHLPFNCISQPLSLLYYFLLSLKTCFFSCTDLYRYLQKDKRISHVFTHSQTASCKPHLSNIFHCPVILFLYFIIFFFSCSESFLLTEKGTVQFFTYPHVASLSPHFIFIFQSLKTNYFFSNLYLYLEKHISQPYMPHILYSALLNPHLFFNVFSDLKSISLYVPFRSLAFLDQVSSSVTISANKSKGRCEEWEEISKCN